MKKKAISLLCIAGTILAGCGNKNTIIKPYNVNSQQSEFSYFDSADLTVAEPFAANLCVVTENQNTDLVPITAESASLYCMDDRDILYAKNVHERLHPASLTKVMTALLAFEYGKLDDLVTITEESMITEADAMVCDLKPGQKYTLNTLVHLSLIRSGNDAAAAIAAYLGGSIPGFVDMMNEKAKQIGATNTHFTNPHGLTDESHYTTAYDMYLIMRETMTKYPNFLDIISQQEYSFTYINEAGETISDRFGTTNRFLNGSADAPSGVTVIGGKTGTTNAAGSCLALLSKSNSGKWYCSIILKADGSDLLYSEMSSLLALEN